jgi:hypothetical protein
VHDEPLDDTAGNDTLLGVEVCNCVSRAHSKCKMRSGNLQAEGSSMR